MIVDYVHSSKAFGYYPCIYPPPASPNNPPQYGWYPVPIYPPSASGKRSFRNSIPCTSVALNYHWYQHYCISKYHRKKRPEPVQTKRIAYRYQSPGFNFDSHTEPDCEEGPGTPVTQPDRCWVKILIPQILFFMKFLTQLNIAFFRVKFCKISPV